MTTCSRCSRLDDLWQVLFFAYVMGTWTPAKFSLVVTMVVFVVGQLLAFLVRRGSVPVPKALHDAWHGPSRWWMLFIFLVLWFGPMLCPWTVVAWSR